MYIYLMKMKDLRQLFDARSCSRSHAREVTICRDGVIIGHRCLSYSHKWIFLSESACGCPNAIDILLRPPYHWSRQPYLELTQWGDNWEAALSHGCHLVWNWCLHTLTHNNTRVFSEVGLSSSDESKSREERKKKLGNYLSLSCYEKKSYCIKPPCSNRASQVSLSLSWKKLIVIIVAITVLPR